MISTFLWAFSILIFYTIARLIPLLLNQNEKTICSETDKFDDFYLKENSIILIRLLNKIFYFQKMVDSKLIGPIVFLNSIILTEIINANINTKNASSFQSLVILISYSLVSVGSGFSIFNILEFFKSRSIIVNEKIQREWIKFF